MKRSRASRGAAGAWAGDLWQDLRYGLRGLARNRAFTVVAVLSLAAGIGLNSVVFSVINSIFLRPAHGIADSEDVVFGPRLSYAAFREIRESSRTLSGVAVSQPRAFEVRIGAFSFHATGRLVSENYFAVLGVHPALGRFFTPDADPLPEALPEAVLDHRFWKERLGGDPGVIGKTVTVDGVPLTVIGVTPADLYGPGPERPPVWIRLGMRPALERRGVDWSDPRDAGYAMVGRLRPGVSPEGAAAELRALLATHPGLSPRQRLALSTGGAEGWTGSDSPEKHVEWLLVVVVPLVVAGVILWIGCSNVANILLARGMVRRKETAVRLAMGASRSRIVRQLLTEALLLAALGSALALFLASWLLDLLWAAFPEFPQMYVTIDTRVVVYTGFVSLAATLIFGLVPALQATRIDVAPALKGEAPKHVRSSRLRTFFLVTQVASSMALLVVAGTFVRSVVRTYTGEAGAEIERLLVGRVELEGDAPGVPGEYWDRVRAEIGALPGVAAVTVTPNPAGESVTLRGVRTDGAVDSLRATLQAVDSSYFSVQGSILVGGRNVGARRPDGDAVEVVVNQAALVRLGGSAGAVGREVVLGDSLRARIVGVVRDGAKEARVFRTADERSAAGTVLVRTRLPSERMVAPVRVLLSRLAADRAQVTVGTLREAQFGSLQRLTAVALLVGSLALALAAVGLYGSISFHTTQRTREIAIRLALGAARGQIFGLVFTHGLKVVVAGCTIGLAVVLVALRVMSGVIYGEWPLDVATLVGVATVFALATAAASYLPGRRAARVDPMEALRSE
jgi:predicted permease